MKRAALFLAPLVVALANVTASARPLVIHVQQLRTGTGETVPNARVVIESGRITAVGSAGTVRLPGGAR